MQEIGVKPLCIMPLLGHHNNMESGPVLRRVPQGTGHQRNTDSPVVVMQSWVTPQKSIRGAVYRVMDHAAQCCRNRVE